MLLLKYPYTSIPLFNILLHPFLFSRRRVKKNEENTKLTYFQLLNLSILLFPQNSIISHYKTDTSSQQTAVACSQILLQATTITER
jgi:hypothetical protein